MSLEQGARPTSACSPTPLRVDKIGAILNAGCDVIAFPIYHGGAADAQGVGRGIQWQLFLVLDDLHVSHALSFARAKNAIILVYSIIDIPLETQNEVEALTGVSVGELLYEAFEIAIGLSRFSHHKRLISTRFAFGNRKEEAMDQSDLFIASIVIVGLVSFIIGSGHSPTWRRCSARFARCTTHLNPSVGRRVSET